MVRLTISRTLVYYKSAHFPGLPYKVWLLEITKQQLLISVTKAPYVTWNYLDVGTSFDRNWVRTATVGIRTRNTYLTLKFRGAYITELSLASHRNFPLLSDRRQQTPLLLTSSCTANSDRAFHEDYLVQLRLTSHQLEDVGYVVSEV
jgi:hypothetical protein